MNRPKTLSAAPTTIVPIAVPSPSIIREPNPQSHSGSRTANAWSSGAWSGQVTLAPLARRLYGMRSAEARRRLLAEAARAVGGEEGT